MDQRITGIIYNQEVFERTQANDKEKREKCIQFGIELVEVNISKIKRIKNNYEMVYIVEDVLKRVKDKIKG